MLAEFLEIHVKLEPEMLAEYPSRDDPALEYNAVQPDWVMTPPDHQGL
jgi:hypothetical protein